MTTFTMWIRGREYKIEGYVEPPDLEAGIYGSEFVIESLFDVVTDDWAHWQGNGLELSKAEEAAVSEAYFDTFEPYYYEFEWEWQTEMGAYAELEDDAQEQEDF